MTEAEIRDHLAVTITVLEKGLVLLDREKYIPNSLGTRGFIDLYARDQQGHHVLIELKRSDAASREALHEVHKYVEGVKAHLGARDDEIRVIVASTEWKELLVPFSRFVADSSISVLGLQLHVQDSARTVSASPLQLLPIQQGRFLAPWHDVNWYADEASLARGVAAIESAHQEKGKRGQVLPFAPPPPLTA